MSKNITIKDIAREANVSIATVSYCLNKTKNLKEETKLKIYKAIEELGYNPNLAAKSLVTNESKLIGFVIGSGSFEDNPFYSNLLAGMNSAIKEHLEYDLLIASNLGDEEVDTFESNLTKWIKKRALDAVIFIGLNNQKIIKNLNKLNIPISLIDSGNFFLENIYNIKIDDELGGYLGTKHLIEKGYKNIAFVGEGLIGEVTKLRYEGYKRALKEAKIPLKAENLYKAQVSYEGGIEVSKKLMERKDIDAIFTIADILAFGIMRSYIRKSYVFPRDIALIGFDNLNANAYTTPSLTTIDQNVFMKGRMAVEAILEKKEKKEFIIPIKLIIGEST